MQPQLFLIFLSAAVVGAAASHSHKVVGLIPWVSWCVQLHVLHVSAGFRWLSLNVTASLRCTAPTDLLSLLHSSVQRERLRPWISTCVHTAEVPHLYP